MSITEKRQILTGFPFKEIQLSYETIVHKKVQGAHISMAIPDGIKSYLWATVDQDENVCWLLEIVNGSIGNITKLSNEFSVRMSYGSIFYGTHFKAKNGQMCFSIEDVLYFKGKNVCRTNYLNKLTLMKDAFARNEIQPYQSLEKVEPKSTLPLVIGLPFMDEQFYTVLNAVPTLPYKSSFIHFRYLEKNHKGNYFPQEGKQSNSVYIMKYIKPRNDIMVNQPHKTGMVFSVVADIQPDIYHLTAPDGTTSVACIPSYNVSVMMNSIFRNIKENVNLDALEESDDEEDFEDTRIDKYLIHKAEPVKMKCEYNYKFKKWTPVCVVSGTISYSRKDGS